MNMHSIWDIYGGFVGIGEITKRSTSPFNSIEVRFADGTTDHFNDAFPDPRKWAYGMRFLAPEERPENATEDGIARHAERLQRRSAE